MAFRLPSPPTFLQKHLRLVLIIIIAIAAVSLVWWGLNRVSKRAEDLEVLADIGGAQSALNLYFYFRNDYPPAGSFTENRRLGENNAVCLDKTDEGLRNTCGKKAILRRLPKRNFIYHKPQLGDYELVFSLKNSIGDLRDLNRNGKIECKATKSGITCQ